MNKGAGRAQLAGARTFWRQRHCCGRALCLCQGAFAFELAAALVRCRERLFNSRQANPGTGQVGFKRCGALLVACHRAGVFCIEPVKFGLPLARLGACFIDLKQSVLAHPIQFGDARGVIPLPVGKVVGQCGDAFVARFELVSVPRRRRLDDGAKLRRGNFQVPDAFSGDVEFVGGGLGASVCRSGAAFGGGRDLVRGGDLRGDGVAFRSEGVRRCFIGLDPKFPGEGSDRVGQVRNRQNDCHSKGNS